MAFAVAGNTIANTASEFFSLDTLAEGFHKGAAAESSDSSAASYKLKQLDDLGEETDGEAIVSVGTSLPQMNSDEEESLILNTERLNQTTSAMPTGSVAHYYYADHLGTPRLVADEAGAIVSTHDYEPFGLEFPSAFNQNSHRYTEHERDVETGLDYMMARYYGSHLGRFNQIDVAAADPGKIQSWNKYTYTLNNPLVYIDPNGQWPVIGGDVPTDFFIERMSVYSSTSALLLGFAENNYFYVKIVNGDIQNTKHPYGNTTVIPVPVDIEGTICMAWVITLDFKQIKKEGMSVDEILGHETYHMAKRIVEMTGVDDFDAKARAFLLSKGWDLSKIKDEDDIAGALGIQIGREAAATAAAVAWDSMTPSERDAITQGRIDEAMGGGVGDPLIGRNH